MKVGLYNAHLRTLGGGEQHALAIAHWLLDQGHTVEVLARPGVTIEACEERLGIGLGGARLVELPDQSREAEEEASHRSAGYDLFVNATYASGARSRAPLAALLVYFPIPPGDLPQLPAKDRARWVGVARERPLGWIENDHGLYDPEAGGAWSDGRASYRFRLSKAGQGSVKVTLGSPRPPGIPAGTVRFELDTYGVLATHALPRNGVVTLVVPLPADGTDGHLHRFNIVTDRFNLAELGLADDRRDLGAFIQSVELDCGNHPDELVEYGWRLRNLESYDLVLANSHYTSGWIGRVWGGRSEVLYPPVVCPPGRSPESRTPAIVALGRFFEGSHSKKQLELVQAFAAMCDAGLDGWTFHVIGGAGADGIHYLERVRRASEGYPIQIHANAPRSVVETLLGEASLFWQATGWGEDPEAHPERFEHFGIALVEAMGAGAVPVVLDGGAAHEVVRHGKEGLLWPASAGPVPATLALTSDPRRRMKLASRAASRAENFSPTAFDRRMAKLFRTLC